MSGKGPEGGSNGKGERGPTSRLAPPSRAGAPFRHTPACSDRGRVELDWRRGTSHPAASGHWLPSSNREMSSSYCMDRSAGRGSGRSGRSQSFR